NLLEDLPPFLQESVVRKPAEQTPDPDTRIELTKEQTDTVLRTLIKDYRNASKHGATAEELADYQTKIDSAFNALKVKDGWNEQETSERREYLDTALGRDANKADTTTSESEEPSARQLDRNLRGLLTNYRRTKAN